MSKRKLFRLSDSIFLFFRITLILAPLVLLSLSCKNNPIKPDQWQIQLTNEDASCTEIYLKLQLGANVQERTVTLKRDNTELWTRNIDAAEIEIIDTNLIPGHTYTYTATLDSPTPIWLNNNPISQIQVRTMDTTSHNFTWQTFTLGDGTGSSVLYDVAIINDTLAYAVGQIYRNDTTFNAAKWDGTQWELKRITVNFRGSSITPPLEGVFLFSSTDIWFVGSLPIYGDGLNWNIYDLRSMSGLESISLSKGWGTSSSSMYFCGRSGSLVFYNGGTWTKLESGTSLTLNDIWGGSNKFVGENVVLIPASEKYTGGEKRLLRLRNNSLIDTIPWPMQDRRIHSIWFEQQSPIFTSGGGVFQSREYGTWNEMPVPLIFTNRIRGNASNDLIVVGDFGIVAHYNGVLWRVFNELAVTVGNYEAVSISDNLIVIAGFRGSNAIIAIGRRD